ncbi:hypothetical protein [Herbinix luporum]|mgnify:CR=1 FL=1|uniref:Uncharacterized protein n=1 Tax=Herbinix luporum TaxID=1679721 RepID=A0A0K8J7W3_9FIRM|nr:hypothetical protein [Herbinix luporum]MDI9488698.1 hypothetical protein [Bacillota bacterium]CUH93736.1 hypothetical protein SD1D_2221 [Herbinix luporum]HHT57206.1 hypothetical protein [Herbinix luporum]
MAATKPKENEARNQKIPPELQADKHEVKKRLEREKKALKKKQLEEDFGRQKRQIKGKKNTKTNWTRQYEYGLLDEDDYSDY